MLLLTNLACKLSQFFNRPVNLLEFEILGVGTEVKMGHIEVPRGDVEHAE